MLSIAGEALIDLIKTDNGLLKPVLGGSPFNLANALGRLGRDVAYLNPLSQDSFGSELANALQHSQVKLQGGFSPLPTSLAVVQIDAQGKPSYGFYREGIADRDLPPTEVLHDWPASSAFFHVGSLSLIPPDGQAWHQVLATLVSRGVTTSVDVNMRPKVCLDNAAYVNTVKTLMGSAALLKVSDEDLHELHLRGDPLVEARALLNEVTRVVLLTLGEKGAWGLTRNDEIFQAPPKVKLVDTVGAGDCFYAGFIGRLDELGALMREPTTEELTAALAFGAATTAFNLERQGCVPPWRHEIPL